MSEEILEDGGYIITSADGYTTEKFTPTFDGHLQVPISKMHLVCSDHDNIQMGNEIYFLGRTSDHWFGTVWNSLKWNPRRYEQSTLDWFFGIIFRFVGEDEKMEIVELLMSPQGTVHGFYNHKDLKSFIIQQILKKEVLFY